MGAKKALLSLSRSRATWRSNSNVLPLLASARITTRCRARRPGQVRASRRPDQRPSAMSVVFGSSARIGTKVRFKFTGAGAIRGMAAIIVDAVDAKVRRI
jgi:hypothetical protein